MEVLGEGEGGDVGEDAEEEIEGAFGGGDGDEVVEWSELGFDEVAEGKEDGGFLLREVGDGKGGEGGLLADGGGADEDGVLDFADAGEQVFGEDHVAHSPTGHAEGFGEGEEGEGVVGGFGDAAGGEVAGPRPFAEVEMFEGFVRDVVDVGIAAELVDVVEGVGGVDGAGGIVGGDGDDGPCFVGDGVAEEVGLELKGFVGGDDDGFAAGEDDGVVVVGVPGGVEDDFIAGVGDGEDGVEEGHASGGGNDEAGRRGRFWIFIFVPEFLFEGVEERGEAGGGGVLVVLDVAALKRAAASRDSGRGPVDRGLREERVPGLA